MQESSVYQHLVETATEERYQQGIEQGIEQGAAGAKREAVVKLLAHRFGSVPQPIANRISQLHHISQLDALFDAVMQAESLEDIQM